MTQVPASGEMTQGAPGGSGLYHFRSPVTFSLTAAVFFLAVFNMRFWQEMVAVFWQGRIADALFLLLLALVLVFGYAAALLLLPGRSLLKGTVIFLFPVCAMASFCADSFGLAIDQEMIRSLMETNRREAVGLVSPSLLLYAVGLGVLPLFLVGRASMAAMNLRRHLLHRAVFLMCGLALIALAWTAFPSRLETMHRHAHLRYLSVPGAAVDGAARFAAAAVAGPPIEQVAEPGGMPHRVHLEGQANGAKPLLMFLVVGETARHGNFQLGGYARPTNPRLSRLDHLYYFSDVTSCGTTTAISLPCMFSHLGRDAFSLTQARRHANVLDTLAKAGVRIEWRDNNAGSKGVSARIKTVQFRQRNSASLCDVESCLDEILLSGLEPRLRESAGDTLIAFHQMGSHGPAYHKRYPQSAETFAPVCRTNELTRCSQEEVRNAYDNTIVYTDRLLAEKIALLKSLSDRFDTLLLYVSDHGESLGENGIHLHGAPYELAPEEQKRIPFIIWLSDGYRDRFGMDTSCMRRQSSKSYSHDNLYHTLQGAMATRNALYRSELDMLAACRGKAPPAPVEQMASMGAERAGQGQPPEASVAAGRE
ncbi:phosphoethanolamine--lipid A transferase [Noviherbaspirillum sp. CPCC 100848]|uniref:Phosphoethanolamine--lipid A transferase n=1 Tax=Noviherbaspirillum album TaxID=3080276 RepID=A0ABU6JDU1_9BURK|nr:phosphoethanolamine--lipid A transferase [Noviherbaspirillum sp. CPCC 100848]MEC4721626.1 phosphoethanolamine--lipid A transferase [Noviherbaspirillum sp. CPCC 100848]